jgi:pyruvate kinase
VAILVVTTSPRVAQQANAVYGCVPFLLSEPCACLEQAKRQAVEFARLQGLADFVVVRRGALLLVPLVPQC